jgi:thioredoxin reductase (NADPH)
VVGGGDSALEEALTLTHYASRVVLLHRGEAFDGQQALVDRVVAAPTIEVRWRTELEAIVGDGVGQGVRLRDAASGQTVEEVVSGVFIFVGLEPNGGLLDGVVPLDRSGHVPTDLWMRTEVPGLFAAGDVRQHSASQLVTAAGDGATAAIAAYRYVRGVE